MTYPSSLNSKYLLYLRTWIGLVAIMAFGNTIQCFRDHTFLASRLYIHVSKDVTPLMARLFGTWTLLSAGLRLYCAISICNKAIYNLTLFSFFLAFGHFVTELFVYETAAITIGVISPLVVSSLSITCMLIGYRYLKEEPITKQSEPDMISFTKKKKS